MVDGGGCAVRQAGGAVVETTWALEQLGAYKEATHAVGAISPAACFASLFAPSCSNPRVLPPAPQWRETCLAVHRLPSQG